MSDRESIVAAMPLLRLEELTVHFPTPQGVARAVDGLTLAIDAGEIVGLVGESGCGKSVTALAILGLLPQGRATIGGRVVFLGRDLLTLPPSELRQVRGRDISMIFQDPLTSLNPVFTIGDQIGEVTRLHLGHSRAQARAAAMEALALVGIERPDERIDAYPGQLSGGMRQRAMIAMAMAAKPKLLIADEPTTALDVTTQAQVLQLLHELRTKTGTAILMITHDLGVVAELCERAIVLYAGRIAEAARVNDLFSRPRHPYTQGLLRAVQALDAGGVEAAIPGRVAPATDYPPGCRFHPRCPQAMAICRRAQPPLLADEAGQAACWLLEPDAPTED